MNDDILYETPGGVTYPEPIPDVNLVEVHRKAFGGEQECDLVEYHAPLPVMVEYHHQKPVYLQNRLYGRIVYGPSLWLCGNCHDAVHAWLYWLMGERRKPARIGRAAKAEAEATFAWYLAEKERLGL